MSERSEIDQSSEVSIYEKTKSDNEWAEPFKWIFFFLLFWKLPKRLSLFSQASSLMRNLRRYLLHFFKAFFFFLPTHWTGCGFLNMDLRKTVHRRARDLKAFGKLSEEFDFSFFLCVWVGTASCFSLVWKGGRNVGAKVGRISEVQKGPCAHRWPNSSQGSEFNLMFDWDFLTSFEQIYTFEMRAKP